jgi:hypothetical protein
MFAQARELREYEVRTAVETWVRHVAPGAQPDAFIEWLEPFEINGETGSYIAHLAGGGYCLCGNDELVLPVYWYSPHGRYDPDIPDLEYILREIASLKRKLNNLKNEDYGKFQQLQPVFQERAELWEDLLDGRIPTRRQLRNSAKAKAAPDSMSLALTTIWDQNAPYNLQCPQLPTTGYTCLVGCVATSMAQIMNYWQWPASGTGSETWFYDYRWRNGWDQEPLAVNPGLNVSGWMVGRLDYDTTAAALKMNGYWDHSFYLSAIRQSDSTGYRQALDSLWSRMNQDTTWLPVNYGATTYRWDLMADSADAFSPQGEDAVATLCYHAGVSCHMNYHVFVSTTNEGEMINALKDHFFYDQDAATAGVDMSTMTEEIQWMRPFAVAGTDTAGRGSHVWTYFGYDKSTDPDRSFRMNMGWSGNGDGWFTYDTVATVGYVFDVIGQTRYISPTSVKFVGAADLGDGSPNDPYRDIEEAIVEAPDNTTLVFKAGSDNTFSGSLTINRPLTLIGHNASIHSSKSGRTTEQIEREVHKEVEGSVEERNQQLKRKGDPTELERYRN